MPIKPRNPDYRKGRARVVSFNFMGRKCYRVIAGSRPHIKVIADDVPYARAIQIADQINVSPCGGSWNVSRVYRAAGGSAG